MSLNGNHIKPKQQPLAELQTAVSTQIISQSTLITRALVALLADGHVLLEGMPGLAKTPLLWQGLPRGLRPRSGNVFFGCCGQSPTVPPVS